MCAPMTSVSSCRAGADAADLLCKWAYVEYEAGAGASGEKRVANAAGPKGGCAASDTASVADLVRSPPFSQVCECKIGRLSGWVYVLCVNVGGRGVNV